MKEQKLGDRLALNRQRQHAQNLAPAAAWTQLSEREATRASAVELLFDSAAKRLGRLIRLEGAKWKSSWAKSDAPVRVATALRSLEAGSAPLHWALAVKSRAHPFHQDWSHFKQWARAQQLFFEAGTGLDPVVDRNLYVAKAGPLR